MLKFPDWLKPQNSHLFRDEYISIKEKQLREQIYQHIISRKSEDEYFDLELARRKISIDDGIVFLHTDICKIVELVQTELIELGWKTQLAFGQTGLFIYSTEKPPQTCW